MLRVERFVNELMTSNCYVVYDEDTKRCLIIDPGSEKSLQEIEFIESNDLVLDYIIITHEHTDHNWGINALRSRYTDSKLLCSEECSKHVKRANKAYFLLYYDDPDYHYVIAPADYLISKRIEKIEWNGHSMDFVLTPGHSLGSMCIYMEGMLFSGDTIMPFKPYFNRRDSNEDEWMESVSKIISRYLQDTIVYPGHGDTITLGHWVSIFR